MVFVSIEDGTRAVVIGNIYLEPTWEIGVVLRNLGGSDWEEEGNDAAGRLQRVCGAEILQGKLQPRSLEESIQRGGSIWREKKARRGVTENFCRSGRSWRGNVDEAIEALHGKCFLGNEGSGEEKETEGIGKATDGREEEIKEPEFSAREAKEAVWGLGQEKTVGEDGFPTCPLRRLFRIAGGR
ncbi:hypothetical protein Trydic_g4462 [Trypoxylus dichotomus]